MNDFQITPDDPRLTAYALGELDPAEQGAVEAALRTQPELRAVVEDIRTTAARLEAALEAETAATPAEPAGLPLAPVLSRRESRKDEYTVINGAGPRGAARRIFRFPQLYYVVGGLAAACFAVFVALREPPPHVPGVRKTYQVVELRPAKDTAADEAANAAAGGAVAVALPDATSEKIGLPPTSILEQVKRENPPGRLATNMPVPPLPASSADVDAAKRRLALGAAEREGDASRIALRTEAVEQKARAAGGASGGLSRVTADTTAGGAIALAPFTVSEAREQTGAAVASAAITRGDVTLNFSGPAIAPAGSTDLYPGPRPRPMPEPPGAPAAVTHNTEAYAFARDNEFLSAADNPLSTFSIDVDTASYSNVRRFVQAGRLPPADAVRIEELINYFPYRYAPPAAQRGGDEAPFAASLETASAPWAPGHRLVRIGLKGREVPPEARPAANLVFLIDVSGSMNRPNKLPLVKDSLRMLLQRLRSDDRVAIVTYAGQSGLALPSTPVARSREILDALESLHAGGSTNGAMGIQLAYDVAKANFAAEGVNRVILCTDGDFNVGVTSQGELVRLVEEKAKSGVFLTVLGFGMGNLKDATLESLADKGNGAYGYVDTQREAEKLLVEEMAGTLVTIAKDVKIQVDFNPAKVASYRLIGYENRVLKKEDFNNDKVDAGEVGAGHTVTALYEIVPVGAADQPAVASVEESKYQPAAPRAKLPATIANELLTVRIRYKEPTADVSRKVAFPLTDSGADFERASADFKFSSALAAFGMILRDSPHKGRATISSVIEWATAGSSGAADDPRGYRREFLDLARQVQTLLGRR